MNMGFYVGIFIMAPTKIPFWGSADICLVFYKYLLGYIYGFRGGPHSISTCPGKCGMKAKAARKSLWRSVSLYARQRVEVAELRTSE